MAFKVYSVKGSDFNKTDTSAKGSVFAEDQVDPTPTPAPVQQSTGEKVMGVAKSVGNFFEGVGKSFVDMAKTSYRVARAGEGEIKLGLETNNQNAQTDRIGQEIKAASLLPTKEQQRAALLKIGTPSKFINEKDQALVDNEYNSIGLTNHDSTFTTLRKGASDITSTAFGVSMVLDPFAGTLKSIASDAISGMLVKTGLSDVGKSVSEGVAKTVGESVIKDAGEETARITVRSATQEGQKVLVKTASKKLLGSMVNAGVVNSSISVIDQWSKGNNFDTPQAREEALKSAGIAFVTGASLAGGSESIGYVGEKLDNAKVLKDVNSRLGTNYSGEMGAEMARTMNEFRDTYSGVLQQTRISEIENSYKDQTDEVRSQNLQKGREAKVTKSIERSKEALTKLVANTPVHNSYNDAVIHLTDNHGMELEVADPTDNKMSGVKGNKVIMQKGDFIDYLKQVGSFVSSKLKDNGVSFSAFKSEIDKIPDSGVAEMDTPQAKVARMMGEVNGKDSKLFRQNFPNIAAAFDAIHGVVKQVTPIDGAQSFVRDNLPDHFSNIESVIERESTSVRPNPVTGKNEVFVDPIKREKLWLDAQDLIIKGEGDTKVTKKIQDTVEKSNEITSLRDDARKAGDDNPMLKQAFEKADLAISSVKSLDEKIAMWRQHLDIFKIPASDVKSPLDEPVSPAQNGDLGTPFPVDSKTDIPAGPAKTPPTSATSTTSTESTTETAKVEPEQARSEPTEVGTSKVGRDIADKAVASGLTEKFGDTSEYSKVDIKEQAKMSNDLISEDYKKAIRVASGLEDPPPGLKAMSVLVAVENKAMAEGDIETLRQLASSDTVKGTSEAAQTLRIASERDQFSPVSAMRSLSDERIKAYEAKSGTKVDKAIDKTVKDMQKNIPELSKSKVSKFIDDITCK